MRNLETEFVKEMRDNLPKVGEKSIYDIPLPMSAKGWNVNENVLYGVQGITEPEFDKLNKTIVMEYPKGMSLVRKKIDRRTRKFMRDSEGNFVTEPVTVPKNSKAIMSEINLLLRYKHEVQDRSFEYVDVINIKGKILYIYLVSTKNLYRVSQTALAMSVRKLKCYSGASYKTWKYGLITLAVIPYKPGAKYEGTKILATGVGLNYNEQITEVLTYWQAMDVIPNMRLSQLIDGGSVCVVDYIPTYNVEDFIPMELDSVYESKNLLQDF